MAQRPRKSQQQKTQLQQQEDDSNFSLDSGDLIVGVVLLLVIPIATYIFLGIIGYPVKGQHGSGNWEQSLAIKEKIKKAPPPRFSDKEVKQRLKYAKKLVHEYVDRYRSFSAKEREVDPRACLFFNECAQKCLAIAEAELKNLQKDVRRNPDLGNKAEQYEQQVNRELTDLSQIKHELLAENIRN